MTRKIALYLVGTVALVSLAGCGRGFFQTEERAPWRAEAEAACLKSGAVKESADVVRIDPISGPGVCGAEFPLKVAALGEDPPLGFADDLRPPAAVGNNQPRWPDSRSTYGAAAASYPNSGLNGGARGAAYGNGSGGPVSLTAPGVSPADGQIDLPADGETPLPADQTPPGWQVGPRGHDTGESGHSAEPAPVYSRASSASQGPYSAPVASQPHYQEQTSPLPRLGTRGSPVSSFGPVALKPTATLACPIVSALDHWLTEAVQPAAMRWFGTRVVEIKQISAYSCRGMNGNPHAHISEHAFGNALDIAGFRLADGRYISVQHGWKGLPEEQGFLRDVQGAACQRFTTVLAPGANVYHYNHIHVDLMRRAHRRVICKPAAISGEVVAARAAGRNPSNAGWDREPAYTSAIGGRNAHRHDAHDDEDE
jgi:hypothetical protein